MFVDVDHFGIDPMFGELGVCFIAQMAPLSGVKDGVERMHAIIPESLIFVAKRVNHGEDVASY